MSTSILFCLLMCFFAILAVASLIAFFYEKSKTVYKTEHKSNVTATELARKRRLENKDSY